MTDFKNLVNTVVDENREALLDMDPAEIDRLLDAHVVYDTTFLNIGRGDLLVVNCGCTAVGLVVIRLSKKAGAAVRVVTAHPESEAGQLADFTVRLRAPVNPENPDELPSVQHMERRHTNVDGYMSID